MSENNIIQEREKKLLKFFRKEYVFIIIFLILALILGAYIRSLPMQDHSKGLPSIFSFATGQSWGGSPGLWDVATNNWTLGPDLDPWLFTRYAQEIVAGSTSKMDMMRYVPVGFDNSMELQMVSYMIVITYKITNMFGIYNVIFAAAFMPVLLFLLTIISFFLFSREIFINEEETNKMRANIIAAISTLFMITIPAFLSRTVAGIPEKESVGFFFMFLSFYLFLKAWKSKSWKGSIIFSILAGIATALMGLTWGGVSYIYATMAIATLIAFLLNKANKKEIVSYGLWIIFSITTTLLFTSRFSLSGFLTGLDTGLAVVTLFIMIVHFLLWETKLKNFVTKIKFVNETKLPKNILSLIAGIIILLILIVVLLGPGFIIDKANGLTKVLLNPITGRWSTTVAENRQPYFGEWASEFGPTLTNMTNFPIMFWLFFIGSVVLFNSLLKKLNKNHRWILTGLYVLFFFGLVFSRYAPHPAFFDGEDFISQLFYFGSALIFIGFIVYYYIKYEASGENGFKYVGYEYILLFALFVICLFTARSAIRLIMVLGPIAPIFVGYLIFTSVDYFKKSKDETWKIITGIFMILVIIASLFCFYSYYNQITNQAYVFVPSYYNQQWQKAMKWVDDDTPKNAVFAHWWDYGYWVQSIGHRATVLDGGNAKVYWNYLMGRLVLTGDNQTSSLEYLYSHNATHLLIDSSDIGKYGAFSSIGSDKNYDRFSWIGSYILDEKQTQETSNQTIFVYTGGTAIDENLIINDSGKEILLPSQSAGAYAIVIPMTKKGNNTFYEQPSVIFVYQGKQYHQALRYMELNGQFKDYGSGIEACAFIFPSVASSGSGVSKNNIGAAMYISPRLLRGFLAQKYILNDPFNKFPNFKLNHTEPNLIIDSLNKQGMNLPDFIYYQGVQGPIKIWDIEYTGKEKVKQEYLDTDASKYLDWEL